MADVTVEFGAQDVGLDKTLKQVQAEMTKLEGKVKSGELSMTELEQAMKKIAQTESLEKKLQSMDTGFGKIGIAAGLAGAAAKVGMMAVEAATDAARAVVDKFGAAIDLGGKLNDLSSRTGETAGSLLVLERAFTNTGVSSEAVGTSINKMQKFMVDAAQGGSAQSDAMARLGITMGDLAGKTPTEQMGVFASRISSIQDPAQRAEAAMTIFGKSGGELLPILQNFQGELEGAKGQLGSLPGVMDRSAAAFDSLGDSMASINNKVLEFAAGFLEKALPALNKFTSALSGVDAAGWGEAAMSTIVRIADRLIGAFKDPLPVIEAYGTSFEVAAKTFGNAFFNTSSTVIDFLIKSFETNLASAVTAYLGGALIDAALTFGRHITEALMTFSAAISELPGFKEAGDKMFQILDEANNKLGEAQKANMGETAEAAKRVTEEFDKTASKTRVFKEDFFGAEDATKRMNEQMDAIESSGKETRENFIGAEGSSSATAANIQNAVTNSASVSINFGSANSSSYDSNEYMKKANTNSISIAKEWSKVAGSAYSAEQSTYGAQAAMAKAVREMSDKDMGNLFKAAKQDLIDMGGDMKTLGQNARNIPQLAESLGIETAGKSAKQMMYEIGQEVKTIAATPIEINVKFSPEIFAAGLESLRTDASNAFQQVPLNLDAAQSIAEQATAVSDGFKNKIPLNLNGYDSIADTRKAAEDNFANAIPLTMSGDSAANSVLETVQNRLKTDIPLTLNADSSISDAYQSASSTFSDPLTLPTTADTTAAQDKIADLSTKPVDLVAKFDMAAFSDSLQSLKSAATAAFSEPFKLNLTDSLPSLGNGSLDMPPPPKPETSIFSELKSLVSDIKELVGKIEPKLPVAALSA